MFLLMLYGGGGGDDLQCEDDSLLLWDEDLLARGSPLFPSGGFGPPSELEPECSGGDNIAMRLQEPTKLTETLQ